MAGLSPMMQQYMEIKEQHKDQLLFYRVGDFYEMFFDDALVASRELELVLTGKDCGLSERAPMCGVPYHSAEGYIGKLISKGYKVAICEQMENPAETKGIVKREVVREITPGTVVEASLLNETKNTYLCSLYFHRGGVGESYNVGGCNEWRNIDLVKLLIRTTDRLLGRAEGEDDNLISYVADRPGHDLRYAIDATKIKRELGWEPSLSFEEGIERTVKWYLDHPHHMAQ